ncbi:MAG: helix-turn-helix domain-containing protein [Candidatus Diapherotrites archaeon]|nr:helix-turn-helix domain-containing protein [Candidatus Diapherotrites archaeon]
MDTKVLEELGFTPGEVKVYLALIGLGESTTGPIVNEAGISVSKVYPILERLAKKGLVSHIVKQKVKYFKAADPQRLLVYMKEKEEHLQEQEKKLRLLLPSLELKQQSIVTEETAQVFDGLRGIQTARERTLSIMKKGDEMWIVGIARTPYDRLTNYFKDYHDRRIAKGIRCKYIYDEYARKPFGEDSAKYKLSDVRYLPEEMITHSWIEIYADTITIGINFKKSFSVVIQNQDVADSFRNYAKLMWKLAKP